MKFKLLAVGRLHQRPFELAAAEYGRRLAASVRFEQVEVRDVRLTDRATARQKEAQALLAQLKSADHPVLLDSGGIQFDSPGLANWLQAHSAEPFVFIVGSSWGVDSAVRERAKTLWSLSKLTFPHELARVIVLEQLYRAVTILAGHPYHH